jgi:carbonic anhydrase
MNTVDTIIERNADFAARRFVAGLPLMPTMRTMVIACVDPRVDPAHILGLEPGEAVVIRNVGGRITPATLQEMGMLGAIPRAAGVNPGGPFNLVVLHHTDCGITHLAGNPDLLASYFRVSTEALPAKAISDPHAAVAADIAALRATPALPDNWIVSGLVYDVATGRVETVVAPAPLRAPGGAA